MRHLAAIVALICVSLAAADEKKNDKPLSPAEAIKKVDEKVVVEMLVQASKNRLEKFKEIYLDSELDFKDEKNLAIVITESCAAKFKEAGVDEPAGHFKGKTIRVTGTVTIKDKRPRIEVNEPKQIEIVKKD
jgi:DNA/RNA endonuclease YhcR with UshA esterase domain